MIPTLKEQIDTLRAAIKGIGDEVKAAKQHPEIWAEGVSNEDRGEMLANLTLAFRHLEDARMRLGKVLQAQDGGVSILDKPPFRPEHFPKDPAQG